MKKPKSRWGAALFLLAVPLLAAAAYIVFVFPPAENAKLYGKTIPWTGIILSITALAAGHFSYPRVHNLKVYLVGYLTALSGLAYFVLYGYPSNTERPVAALFILIFFNILLVLSLPSFVKYRITRRVTYSIVAIEAGWLVFARAFPKLTLWAHGLMPSDTSQWQAWVGIGFAGAAACLTLWLIRDEFYLGGIFSGLAAVYCIAWLSSAIMKDSRAFEQILFAVAPLYLNMGIIFHWFLRMEHRVSYDPLLHIYNRNYCSRIITEQSNLNTAPPFAVAMIDIDHFKKVNDTYGHQAGDTVLYNVAQAIVREVVPHGVVCRYGGEEMVVFFPKKTAKDILPVVEKVRAAIEKTKIPTRRKKLSVTVSCGVSHRDDSSQSVIDVIHAADKALYKAKKGGRNQVKSMKSPSGSAKKK